MAKSRLNMRREVEAAEALEKTAPAKKKASRKSTASTKAAKPAKKKKKSTRKKATSRTRKTKDTPTRRRLVWVIYSSTMREEGRFLYHDRDQAEEKLEQLLSKGKRRYFIQPVKEPLDADGQPISQGDVTAPPVDMDEDAEVETKPAEKLSEDVELDEADDAGDVDVADVAEDDGD
ncbi:MAG: hypothetical protein R3C19_24915 [Planctomycetaceae bacterium]